jgi:glycosyltransferase involved in cell wall biosynthesis
MPAYNAAAFVEDAIKSVLVQSRPADEIVVVDDGSTDKTGEIAAGVSPRVVVLRQKNGGQGSARQRGADATKAELLLFLDTDDVLNASALEKLSAALLSDPSAALAYCRAELWSPTNQFPLHDDNLQMPACKNAWAALLYGNFIRTPGCVLIRRADFVDAGGWDTHVKLKGNEDWDLWLRLAETKSFVVVPEALVKYRMAGTGFCSDRRKMYRSMFRMFAKQRTKWRRDAARRVDVAIGRWNNCHFVLGEILRTAKLEYSKGRLERAAALMFEMARTCGPSVAARVLSVTRARMSRWRFLPFGKQSRSLSS